MLFLTSSYVKENYFYVWKIHVNSWSFLPQRCRCYQDKNWTRPVSSWTTSWTTWDKTFLYSAQLKLVKVRLIQICSKLTYYVDSFTSGLANFYLQLKKLSTEENLTIRTTMIWLLWPWDQWLHWETLATCLIITLTASTAPPPTVSILSSYLSRLVIIQVQERYQKSLSCIQLACLAFQASVHQSLGAANLTPSSLTLRFQVSKQEKTTTNVWSYLHSLYFDSFLISHHFIDRSVHQARERRVPIETTTGATS